jgi:hypothetical protein
MFINDFRSTKAIDARFASRLFLAAIFAVGVLVAPARAQASGGPVVGTPCSKLGATEMSADSTDILACVYAPAPTLLWQRFGGTAPLVTVANDCGPAISCGVTCPAGARVTGGGCSVSAPLPSGNPGELKSTAPSGNGWACAIDVGPNPSLMIAYAICSGP